MSLTNGEDVIASLFRGWGEKNLTSARANNRFKLLQVLGQVRDRVFLDLPRLILQCVVIRQGGGCAIAIAIKRLRIAADGRTLNLQSHSSRAEMIQFVAFVRDSARRLVYFSCRSWLVHRDHSNNRMCKRCGPCTPRTNGPISAVAFGPVMKTRFLRSPSPPKHAGSKRSRGRATIRAADSNTI